MSRWICAPCRAAFSIAPRRFRCPGVEALGQPPSALSFRQAARYSPVLRGCVRSPLRFVCAGRWAGPARSPALRAAPTRPCAGSFSSNGAGCRHISLHSDGEGASLRASGQCRVQGSQVRSRRAASSSSLRISPTSAAPRSRPSAPSQQDSISSPTEHGPVLLRLARIAPSFRCRAPMLGLGFRPCSSCFWARLISRLSASFATASACSRSASNAMSAQLDGAAPAAHRFSHSRACAFRAGLAGEPAFVERIQLVLRDSARVRASIQRLMRSWLPAGREAEPRPGAINLVLNAHQAPPVPRARAFPPRGRGGFGLGGVGGELAQARGVSLWRSRAARA